MSAIYNELEQYPAQWIRNLIAAGYVAPGVVDERSIVDLRAADVAGHGQRHFFAGIGVWSYAMRLAGVPDDADVWTASCPCQPFSDAGRRRGTADERHLWPVLRILVEECRPAILFGEQVASRDGRAWLAVVRADLEALGYAVGAADLCAAGVGAPHIRQRLYFVAYADGAAGGILLRPRELRSEVAQAFRCGEAGDQRLADAAEIGCGARRPSEASDRTEQPCGPRAVSRLVDPDGEHAGRVSRAASRTEASGAGPWCVDRPFGDDASASGGALDPWADAEWIPCSDGRLRPAQPGARPLAHGVAGRVGRLRAYGNAIVTEQAATFIRAALGAGGVIQ